MSIQRAAPVHDPANRLCVGIAAKRQRLGRQLAAMNPDHPNISRESAAIGQERPQRPPEATQRLLLNFDADHNQPGMNKQIATKCDQVAEFRHRCRNGAGTIQPVAKTPGAFGPANDHRSG